MIRKHKNYSRPKKPFDLVRMKSENILVEKYGLKNKREIWKAKAKLDSIRRRAKELLRQSSEEEQHLFLEKLSKRGFKVENVVDVLALTEEHILDRRLQTVVFSRGIATTPKGARQMITHKNISIDGNVVNIPSYQVDVSEEDKIKQVKRVRVAKVTPEGVPSDAKGKEPKTEAPVAEEAAPSEEVAPAEAAPEAKKMEVAA